MSLTTPAAMFSESRSIIAGVFFTCIEVELLDSGSVSEMIVVCTLLLKSDTFSDSIVRSIITGVFFYLWSNMHDPNCML